MNELNRTVKQDAFLLKTEPLEIKKTYICAKIMDVINCSNSIFMHTAHWLLREGAAYVLDRKSVV